MKRRIFALALILIAGYPLFAYKLRYVEEYYRLYHRNFYPTTANCLENIQWLEAALRADFANPLNALAEIETEREWERYRYLFYTHLSLKLVETYLTLGSGFDKQHAYFFNAPWKEENLRSLDIAEDYYEYAIVYWEEALYWSEKAEELPFIHLEEILYWAEESYRITTGDLNYREIINGHLQRLRQVRADFEAMDENTY